MTILNISSEATGPIVTKFYVEPSGDEGTQICSNGPGHMTNMMAIPKDTKRWLNIQKSLSLEPKLLLALKLDIWH